ncbi:MAG: sugar transferase [Candidatus Krumholzibacteria bacterium]|nr:sugar transferase [Candidatus Krumholzibacteria bacterium]
MVVFHRSMAGSSNARESFYTRKLEPLHSEIELLGDLVSDPDIETPRNVNRVKRAFDLLFAITAMIFVSPLLLIAAIVIKLESPGPIFFAQERIGLNRRRRDRRGMAGECGLNRRANFDRRKNLHAGRPFKIYKLRTMRTDAEESGPKLAQKNDPRITRAGNLLRKTRIDEIPQFLNVIKGEMSIVGPRPERSFFINQIRNEVPEFPLRLRVKPGITGLAQVEDGYTQTLDMMKRKLMFDLRYISQFSLFHEIRILFKTVFVVFTGKGAC